MLSLAADESQNPMVGSATFSSSPRASATRRGEQIRYQAKAPVSVNFDLQASREAHQGNRVLNVGDSIRIGAAGACAPSVQRWRVDADISCNRHRFKLREE